MSAWDFYQAQIHECDQASEQILREIDPGPGQGDPPQGRGKPAGSNSPHIADLHRLLVRLCGGRDPTSLPGMADYSLLRLISEVGTDLSKWPSDKHFTAWSGLAPGSAQSGKRRRNQPRQLNRVGQFFCTMARSAGNSIDTALGGSYRRLKARRGGLVANKALARKLAALFWRVMVHGLAYVEEGLKRYQARAAATETRLLRKLALKHGMQLLPIPSPST